MMKIMLMILMLAVGSVSSYLNSHQKCGNSMTVSRKQSAGNGTVEYFSCAPKLNKFETSRCQRLCKTSYSNCTRAPCSCLRKLGTETLYDVSKKVAKVCTPTLFNDTRPTNIIPRQRSGFRRLLQSEPAVYFESACICSDSALIINYLDTNVKFLQISKRGINYQEVTSLKTVSWPYPLDFGQVSGSILVTTLEEDGSKSSCSCFQMGSSECVISDCIFCSEVFESWKCMPGTMKAFFTVIMLTLSFILFIMCICCILNLRDCVCLIMKLVMSIFCCPNWCMNSQMATDAKGKVSHWGNKFYMYARPRKSKEEGRDVELEELPKPQPETLIKPKGYYTSSGVFVPLLLMMISMTVISAQCTSGVVSMSPLYSCLYNDGVTNCLADIEVNIVLQTLNSKSCLVFIDPNNNQTWMRLNITYVGVQQVINLDTQYYSGVWTPFIYSEKRCYDAGQCPGACGNDPNTDPSYMGEIDTSSSILTMPGESTCRRVCGCAGCDCFFCDDACVFSRYGLHYIPGLNNYYIVKKLGQRYTYPTILIEGDLNGGNFTTQVTVVGNEYQFPSNNNTVIKVLGLLAADETAFETFDVVTLNGTAMLAVTSPVNEPTVGLPGDIQAVSLARLEDDQFIFDTKIATMIAGSDFTNYTFRAPGIVNTQGIALPAIINGGAWDVNPHNHLDDDPGTQNLVGQITRVGALELLLTSSNLIVQQIVTLVCPVMSILNATGCRSCFVGFDIYISAYSSCLPGIAFLTVSEVNVELSTTSINLGATAAVYLITAQTQDKFNNFDLTLVSGSKYAEGSISFVATDPILINNVTFVNGTPVATTPSSGGMSLNFRIREWFKNFFKGLASWWSYLIAVVIAIAVIGALILITPTIIRIIMYTVRKNRMRAKDSKLLTHEKFDTNTPTDAQSLSQRSFK